MSESPMTEAHKRALILAYYLSRFDRKGVRALGYESFDDAFQKMGVALDVKPSTIKHMRDSFDPYCSQVRVGWYQRKILPSRANVIQAYDAVSEQAMAEIVREILTRDEAATQLYTAPVASIEAQTVDLLNQENAFAARQRTGDQAEAFFINQYPQLARFQGSTLEDTRKLGIGFDFRVAFPQMYFAVEVKGVGGEHGYVSFTDKEWAVAQMLNVNYLLALVRSLDHTPMLELFPDPTTSFVAKMRSVESVSISWSLKV